MIRRDPIDNAYRALASAIVIQAVKDTDVRKKMPKNSRTAGKKALQAIQAHNWLLDDECEDL